MALSDRQSTKTLPDEPSETGLSEAEARRRLAKRGRRRRRGTGRSYLSIVVANVFTVFNLILVVFGVITLVFGDARDALFLGILVINSGIGIFQEVRAKRAVDRLSLLVAARADVVRDGETRSVPAEKVVPDDVVRLGPGDQVVADGALLRTNDLRVDESSLTGESEPVAPGPRDEIKSGAYVVEGTATYRVTAVGDDSFASRITGEAKSFRHPRSPLQQAIDRLLYVTVVLVVLLGTLLLYSLRHRHVSAHTAAATSTAGVVSLVPEGLIVLVSVTYAAAAYRMSRRGVLAQQLNAIESLASVDTLCTDKTGTLTEAKLRVVELLPASGQDPDAFRQMLGAFAASASNRNTTLEAIAEECPGEPRKTLAEVPFSSRRRWSAVEFAEGSFYLGAPSRIPPGDLASAAEERQDGGRRVVVFARGDVALPAEAGERPGDGLQPWGVVVLAEQLRPNVRDTIAYLLQQDIDIKLLSGDSPRTAAAIAQDVGIPVNEATDGSAIPDDPEARRRFAADTTVVGRISPQGKQAMVQALHEQGRYVAMIGDGVNDVPALKSARLGIAQGSGAQMARSVADLVLVNGDFASIPDLISEGRQSLRNLQRVSKLYFAKSSFAAFLIVTVGLSSDAYPLLPRHLTLASSLTIGIPSFLLALAPSTGPWGTDGFGRKVARFAVPAGALIGTGVLSGYLFGFHDLDLSVAQARMVALTTLVATGLYLVMALEAGGSSRRSRLVAQGCGVMALLYVLAVVIPFTRDFFSLTIPTLSMLLTALLASVFSVAGLWASGFTLDLTAHEPDPPEHPEPQSQRKSLTLGDAASHRQPAPSPDDR